MSNYTGASFISRPTEDILLTKADLVYVDTQLSSKTDFDYTTLELQKKASLTFLESELSGKVSVFQLDEKVNQIQYDSHVSVNEQNITNLYNEQANITQQVQNVQNEIGIRPTTDTFNEAVDILNTNIASKVSQVDYNSFLDTNFETNNSIFETIASKVSQDDYNSFLDTNFETNNYILETLASKASNASVELKANINNASLTGDTIMTKLQINHSDTANIGLKINNTNTNQYMGELNTSGHGLRIFNNSLVKNNTTFGVFTENSTDIMKNPLLVKNDGKLYTLDQEVDGDINLTTGHAFKIDGVAITGGGGGITQAQLDLKLNRTGDAVTLNSLRVSSLNVILGRESVGSNLAIAIGDQCGVTSGNRHIAIGVSAGKGGTSGDSGISIGYNAGRGIQGANSINIGSGAGWGWNEAAGTNSINIGNGAYGSTGIPNTININASGIGLRNLVSNTCIIKPIREETSSLSGFMPMYYNPSTGELVSSNL